MKRIRSIVIGAALIAALAASGAQAAPVAPSGGGQRGTICYKVSTQPWPTGTWLCYWRW